MKKKKKKPKDSNVQPEATIAILQSSFELN
jgi:hypothetical protein